MKIMYRYYHIAISLTKITTPESLIVICTWTSEATDSLTVISANAIDIIIMSLAKEDVICYHSSHLK